MNPLMLALPLSLASGVNLYFTVFLIGIAGKLELVETLPAGLDVLTNWYVIAIAGVLGLLEFFADKIQFVDSIWDIFHTFIRPAGAIALSLGLARDLDPSMQTAIALVAGSTALTSHSSKMGFRALVNASPEPASNIIVSVAEDTAVLGIVALMLRFPLVSVGVAAVLLLMLLIMLPMLIRWARFWFRAARARFRRQKQEWDALPQKHAAKLGSEPTAVLHGNVRGIRGVSGHYGYLSVTGDQLTFTYPRLLNGVGLWSLGSDQIEQAQHHRGLLMDVLELKYLADRKKPSQVRFVFLKDRAEMAGRLAGLIG